ncbi:MAG: hypothetical protein ABI053_03280 [Lacisediminihabitans sp.]
MAAFAYAAILTVQSFENVHYPVLAVLALATLAAACGVLIVQSSPYRAPLTRGTHLLIQILALGAVTTSVAADWGTNRYIHDDWPAISLGLIFLALSPFRPTREMVGVGGLVAIYVGFLTLLQVPTLTTRAPAVAFVIGAVTPMLALCFGSTMFSASFVLSLERWHRRAEYATKNITQQLRAGVARSVQQDRVTILNRDVLPFFTDILARGHMSDVDCALAATIADSIRTVMVAEADRSWLEHVIENAVNGVGGEHSADVVDDPERLALMISTDQRTALRALIVALFDSEGFDRKSLRILFRRKGSMCQGVLTATVGQSEHAMKAALAPYFAVMRVTFTDLHVGFSHSHMKLRMSYEQQR